MGFLYIHGYYADKTPLDLPVEIRKVLLPNKMVVLNLPIYSSQMNRAASCNPTSVKPRSFSALFCGVVIKRIYQVRVHYLTTLIGTLSG